jgi:hypothetical protein
MRRVLQLQTVRGAGGIPVEQAWSTISGGNCGSRSWSSFSAQNCSNAGAMLH